MRPCVTSPLPIRDIEFGGPKPLFCVPLVAAELEGLIGQARVAHRLEPEVIEWRADAYAEITADGVVRAARDLRAVLDEPIIFTLRSSAEGGAKPLDQDLRSQCIDAAIHSGLIDLVDVELCNGPAFLQPIIRSAGTHGVRTILSFHDFAGTPGNEALLGTISAMVSQGADVAKVACMPAGPGDVLRLLEVTLAARRIFPAVPLCTMSMGALGVLSRVAGFLYGSDMAFAVGQQASAPGQIPLAEARAIAEALLRYA